MKNTWDNRKLRFDFFNPSLSYIWNIVHVSVHHVIIKNICIYMGFSGTHNAPCGLTANSSTWKSCNTVNIIADLFTVLWDEMWKDHIVCFDDADWGKILSGSREWQACSIWR